MKRLLRVWMEQSEKPRYFVRVGKRLVSFGSLGNSFGLLVLGLGILLFIFGGFRLVRLFDWKNQILSNALAGVDQVKEARRALESGEYLLARDNMEAARNLFLQGQKVYSYDLGLLGALLSHAPPTDSGKHLFEAAKSLSDAGAEFAGMAEIAKKLKLTARGVEDTDQSEGIKSLRKRMGRLRELTEKSMLELDQVKEVFLPKEIRKQVGLLKVNLNALMPIIETGEDMLNVIKPLSDGGKTVLVLLENPSELRPTGGFIGTLGVLKLHDGIISQINIQSVYDFDGQVALKYAPPSPLLNVTGYLGLRDSNWFFNYPDSAKLAAIFYERAGGETPEAVISVTPKLIIDMLKITGPVEMPAYRVEISAENFMDTVQKLTSHDYDKRTNQPKQLIADFFIELVNILGEREGGLVELIEGTIASLNTKDIQLFFRNADSYNIVSKYGWGGEIPETAFDYLAINTANLGGTKTDLKMQDNYSIKNSISENVIYHDLTIVRKNLNSPGPSSTNLSFVRIYVPEGAELVRYSGFEKFETPAQIKGNIEDGIIKIWNAALKYNSSTGLWSGVESGKSFFGGWVSVYPGEQKSIHLEYNLPVSLNELDHYGLILQKQSGKIDPELSLSFECRDCELYMGSNIGNAVKAYESSLNFTTDIFVGAVLRRKADEQD